MLNNFNNSPYLGYNSKQVHNKPTETSLLSTNHISKLITAIGTFCYVIKELNWVSTKKLDTSSKIGHIEKIQSEESVSIKVTTMSDKV